MTAPAVKRVVDDYALFKLLMIVLLGGRQTQRDGEQTGCLWLQVKRGSVRAAHNASEMEKCGIPDAEFGNESVEGTGFAAMGEFHALDIVGNPAGLVSDIANPLGRDEVEGGVGIDEAPDKPRAGDTIDLGPLARHPVARSTGAIEIRRARMDDLSAGSLEGFDATIELAETVQETENFLVNRELRDVELTTADMAFVNGER